MLTMGNPLIQESELGYLAGLIDGEGTITLERGGKKRMNGVSGLQAKVIVANTNQAIIQRTVHLMQKIGVNPHIKSQAAGKYNRGKTMYWVTAGGLNKARKILEAVKPYLIGKLSQANLVLEFIAIRGNTAEAKGKPYGQAELSILDKIRALNFRGMSETEDYKQLAIQIAAVK